MADYPFVQPVTKNYIVARAIDTNELPVDHKGLQLSQIDSCTTDDIQCYDIGPSYVPKLRVPWKDIYLLKSITSNNDWKFSPHAKVFALTRQWQCSKTEQSFTTQYMNATVIHIINEPSFGSVTIKYNTNNNRYNNTFTYPLFTTINNIEIPTVIYAEPAYNSIFYNNITNKKKRKLKEITNIIDDDTDDEIEILSATFNTKKNSKFIEHMTMEQANKLSINSKFDHRDKFGRVFAARVADKKDTNIFVSYDGWESKYNIWCNYANELWRFSKYGSISRRPRHRFTDLTIGDFIDIKCRQISTWKYGEIKQLDADSGQVQIIFENDNKQEKVYWVHLDNTNEVAVFATKAGTCDPMDNTNNNKKRKNPMDNNILLPNKKRKIVNVIDISKDNSIENNILNLNKNNTIKFNDISTNKMSKTKHISKWDSNDIYEWIISIDKNKFEKYKNLKTMLNEQELTGEDLEHVTEENIKNDFGINKFRDKKLLYNSIQEMIKNSENDDGEMELKDDNIPQQYLDPITYEIMIDPVLCCKSGHTYERKTIEDWIDSNGADPITRQKIKKKHLTPNRTLKELIEKWKKTNNYK